MTIIGGFTVIMMPLFAAALVLLLLVFLTVLRTVQSRMKASHLAAGRPAPAAARYRPMLRLLTENGLGLQNRRAFRARRRAIFRSYLRCLTKDYAQLLDGVRAAMVASGIDRPELAQALSRNRNLFMLAICRIELALIAHAVGIDALGVPDLSGLIAGIDALRAQLPVFEPGFQPAY